MWPKKPKVYPVRLSQPQRVFEFGKTSNYFTGGKYGPIFHNRGHKTLLSYVVISYDKTQLFWLTFIIGGHYRVTVKISKSGESVQHGGEVGQLFFTMHSTTDGKGPKSNTVPLNSGGYHEPGQIYTAVIPTSEIPKLKAVEVEWRYKSSVFNPLTWRILAVPMIYIEKVTVDALEIRQRYFVL